MFTFEKFYRWLTRYRPPQVHDIVKIIATGETAEIIRVERDRGGFFKQYAICTLLLDGEIQVTCLETQITFNLK